MAEKTRVAVVGGGPGGLSTAWNLVHGPSADDLDVTIYTMGWRLGGKGATGRGPHGRIQEHGIHGFTGFYWNSTSTLNESFVELYGPNPPAPGPTELPNSIESALIPNDFTLAAFYADGEFTEAPQLIAGNEGSPWLRPIRLTTDQVIETAVSAIATTILHTELEHDYWDKPEGNLLLRVVRGVSKWWVTRALEKLVVAAASADHGATLRILDSILGRFLDHELDRPGAARNRFIALDFLRTMVNGFVEDGVLEAGFEVDSLDGENYLDWLERHGAHPVTVRTGTPNLPALICFLFPDGDSSRLPAMSAASWVSWLVRSFTGKGSPFMFFKAGTGDTVISPIYQSAHERGAHVEFFHKLERVELSADARTVDRLVFRRQVRLASGVDRYEPLVTVDGVAGDVWPAHPDWDQLNPDDVAGIFDGAPEPVGDVIQTSDHADLESYWSAWPGVDDVVLERGRDFDHVVLALPPGTFTYACPSLIGPGSVLKRAMEGLPTCVTLGLQVWLDKTIPELGWDRPLDPPDRYVGASFPLPLNGIADYSDLIQLEGWAHGDTPRSLLYLCGPLADLDDPFTHDFSDHRYPQTQMVRAFATANQYLATAATWLPKAGNDRAANTLGLDPGLLHAPDDTVGVARLGHQYLKVNIDPSERYVMAPKGSAAARPFAWGSGIDNLALAGDWIYTGINVGSFEGAITSGMLAAHALTGFPAIADIAGFDFLHGDLDVSSVSPMIAPDEVSLEAVVDLSAPTPVAGED